MVFSKIGIIPLNMMTYKTSAVPSNSSNWKNIIKQGKKINTFTITEHHFIRN